MFGLEDRHLHSNQNDTCSDWQKDQFQPSRTDPYASALCLSDLGLTMEEDGHNNQDFGVDTIRWFSLPIDI